VKVIVTEKLSDRGLAILAAASGLTVDVKTGLSPEALQEAVGPYDGLVVRSATKVTKAVIERAANLKAIGRAGIGVDNIDVEAASKRGIVVMNAPEGNTVTTAEHAVALMLALAKNIPQANLSVKSGKWERGFVGAEVFNKTLGIIGIGRIGRIVAQRATGLRMNVIAYDPYISKDMADELRVELVSLDDLLPRADFVSLHVPFTEATRNILNADRIGKMKPGARLINCARGGLVDERALREALAAGKLAGAALDVFEKEPPKDNPLLSLPNVICTPHLGASTAEAQENVSIAIAEQMRDYLLRGVIRNAVNVPCVERELMTRLAPYLKLAESLGSLLSQIIEGGLRHIELAYSGEVSSLPTSPLTVSALKGILQASMKDVNMVNAPVLAKERGIRITEKTSADAADFASLVTLSITSDKETRRIAGTLFRKEEPRIVQLDNYDLEAVPTGWMLVVFNEDIPGVIGKMGTILGNNDINIAAMHLGRNAPRGVAAAIYSVDERIPPRVLDDIRALPFVISAKLVRLNG